jgi:hypothetical protein
MTNAIPNPQPARNSANRANRRNALLSTGPRTAAGKQRSSQNALTHGLTSHSPVLATEDLATLGLHYQRLSRQFQKAVDQLREIQSECRSEQERHLKRAAALLELHKHKGIPYDPAELFSEDGFVFSKDQVEAFSQRLMRLNERTARGALAG